MFYRNWVYSIQWISDSDLWILMMMKLCCEAFVKMLKSELVQLVFYSSYSSSKVQASSWCLKHSMWVQLWWLLNHILQTLLILKLWVCKILKKSSFRAHTQIQKWSIYCNCFWILNLNRKKNNEKHVWQCFLCLKVENYQYHIQNYCCRHTLYFWICKLNLQI